MKLTPDNSPEEEADEPIGLPHGNGGRLMRELIEEIFTRELRNPELDTMLDAATLSYPHGTVVMSTDCFTVQPVEFPGGDIGSLAVHGTVNDLAVAGAEPRHLSLGVIIEEGFGRRRLARIVDSLAAAARAIPVRVVTGDTKVVPRGEGGGIYLITTGIGQRASDRALDPRRILPGDTIVVSGPVGDHAVAVMLARGQFGLQGELLSDAASVLPLTRAALAFPGLRFMRDPTRGGLATVMHDIVRACGHGVRLRTDDIPVRPAVRTVCDLLGYDPLYLACEGRVVAIVESTQAEALCAAWHALPEGAGAAIIGTINADEDGVTLETALGGERIIEELEDDPLPRIC
ncbi:MAG: hydrogenase expression/formation protein HypE [Gammaproteobacteria bacterium]|nr:hydrogenase expression/formation protein HypE [Gammaproteobacteria bacterium]